MAKQISELSFRKKVEFYLSTWMGWILILLLCKSCKIKVEGDEILHEFKKTKQPFLMAAWHGRIFVGAYFFRFWRFVALISQHWDGEMIARTVKRLGFETVRGSSTRGGKEAFHKMVDLLKSGRSGVIIPDGPKGPRHQIKNGVMFMALQANVPIIPFTFSAKSTIIFRSWDRFVIPKPFTKVLINIGSPIWVSDETSDKEFVNTKQHIESVMIKQEHSADAFFSK
jgi:lysophospholipid acyltransferase (LPLAT)-like uncharacterized protein